MNWKLIAKSFFLLYGFALGLFFLMLKLSPFLERLINLPLVNASSFLIIIPDFSFTLTGKIIWMCSVIIIFALIERNVYHKALTRKTLHVAVSAIIILALPAYGAINKKLTQMTIDAENQKAEQQTRKEIEANQDLLDACEKEATKGVVDQQVRYQAQADCWEKVINKPN